MSQPETMTRLEVINIETQQVTKAVYMTTQDAKQIQSMADSLLRNVDTLKFLVRATPSAAPVAAAPNKATEEAERKLFEEWAKPLGYPMLFSMGRYFGDTWNAHRAWMARASRQVAAPATAQGD